MSRARVLVVDDDARVCRLLNKVVKSLDLESRTVCDPNQASDEIESFRPSIVLLDLHMRDTDGVEVLRHMARRQSDALVVLVSGMDQRVVSATQSLGESLGLNMGEPIAKPLDITEVKARLEHYSLAKTRRVSKLHPITEPELRQAIDAGEVRTVYQPIVELHSHRLFGIEALARWDHPIHGLVLPERFIPLAESSGLIAELTLFVLEQALCCVAPWIGTSTETCLSINLSPSLLYDLELPDKFEHLLSVHGFAPEQLILEITESRGIDDPVLSMDVLTRLRLKGMRLALDDFGTGFSSLDHLYRLPYSVLKIDKDFVFESKRNEQASTIVQSTIELGRSFGLTIVAEGVEDQVTNDWLRDLGCHMGQGFYISPPMSPEEFELWLKSKSTHH